MKRAFLVAAVAAFLFQVADDRLGAQAPDDLKFFKNFFVTGDYEARGVGFGNITPVDGLATGTINIPADNPATPTVREGVPLGADLLGAFVYWQVVNDTGPLLGSMGVKFDGYDLESPDDPTTPLVSEAEPFGKVLAFEGQASCSNPGGGTGDGPRRTYTYRVDAARFFAVDENPSSPYFGKTIITGNHTISVPHNVQGQQMPIALGASLMVFFRYPDRPEYAAQKNVLNSIVIYDDGVSLGNAQQIVTQPIKGFYQPSATPNAKISYIVGSGDPAKREDLTLPGTLVGSSPLSSLVLDSFDGSDPTPPGVTGSRWDTETYAVNLANPETLSQVSTTLALNNSRSGGRDCLTVAAMVFKTAVKDSDQDGLLDVWEKAEGTAAAPALYDPNGKMLPLIKKMGAKWNHKDMYIEIGYMDTNGAALTYGGELRPSHSHRPGHETLALAGDTFKNAPISNLDGVSGISVHFDVGPSYPACSVDPAQPCANAYIIGRRAGESTTATVQNPNPSLPPITVTLTTGGERVDEMSTVCERLAGEAPWACQYGYATGSSVSTAHPGTVGWKTGYRFIRDALLSITPTPPTTIPPTPAEDYCDTPVNPAMPNGAKYACTLRFDANRRDIFRYAFWAHALGLPKSAEMFLPDGVTPNLDFHTPRTNTGIGDFLGGDTLLTLGAFVDYDNVSPVGTPFQQASTLVHEVGHTLGRRHNGDTLEPNCTPQYFSTMNYLYQLRGVISPTGIPTIKLSSDAYPGTSFDELSLIDGASGLNPVNAPNRMSWYAPILGPLAAKPGVTPATRHCDGSPITNGAHYVRIDTGDLQHIDWQADNDTTDTNVIQDINFDGLQDTSTFSLRGSSDWDKVRLNQVGSRRSPGGYFYIYNEDGTRDIGVGPLTLGQGKGDLGSGDPSDYALGQGKGDLGQGKGDLGLGDDGGGDFFGDEGEVDDALAIDLTLVPPSPVTACQNCAPSGSTDPQNYVRVSWTAPTMAGILRYTPYRALVLNTTTGETGPWTQLTPVPVVSGQRQYFWLDPDSHRLVNGQTYAYEVTTTYRVKNHATPEPNDYKEQESNGSSPDALVTIFTNAAPAIAHNIAPPTIRRNQSTVPLPFTVTDTESDAPIGSTPKLLIVSASVTAASPAILAGQISFSFNIPNPLTPSARTVTVTHSGPDKGTVTIRLQVQDTQCSHANPPTVCTPGTTNATTFNLTVKQ